MPAASCSSCGTGTRSRPGGSTPGSLPACGTACAGVFEPSRDVGTAASAGADRRDERASVGRPSRDSSTRRTRRRSGTVDDLLAAALRARGAPNAMIVPHAGYAYSGPVAAGAYGAVGPRAGSARSCSSGRRTASRSRVSPSPRRPPGRRRSAACRCARSRSRRPGRRDPADRPRARALARGPAAVPAARAAASSRCCRWTRRHPTAASPTSSPPLGRTRHARRREHRPLPLPRRRDGARARPETRRRSPSCARRRSGSRGVRLAALRGIVEHARRAGLPIGRLELGARPTPPAIPPGSSATARSQCARRTIAGPAGHARRHRHLKGR